MCCIGGGEEVIPETRRVGFKSCKLRGCLWLIIFFELAFYPQIYTNIWDYDKPGGSAALSSHNPGAIIVANAAFGPNSFPFLETSWFVEL